jgi:hypothetical protein
MKGFMKQLVPARDCQEEGGAHPRGVRCCSLVVRISGCTVACPAAVLVRFTEWDIW